MTGYTRVNLKKLLAIAENSGHSEDAVKNILATFSCPKNKDVEDFIRYKAIEFAKQGLAQTHLIYASHKGNPVIVGYFALANKYIHINHEGITSKWRKRIKKFAQYNKILKAYVMSAPLIAQLSKNYTNDYNKLITGGEILKMACDLVSSVQFDIGGRITYVECEDKPVLVQFYETYGFCLFGKRRLDPDETDLLEGKYLLQMFKYIKI